MRLQCIPNSVVQCLMLVYMQLAHPHLVQIMGVCAEREHPAILYELMTMGSLADVLFGPEKVCSTVRKLGDIQMRMRIIYEAASGLAYLHSTEGGLEPILHLDVKGALLLYVWSHLHALHFQCQLKHLTWMTT